MSNYSESSNNCRVDFWKPSGKWYTSAVITFRDKDYNNIPIHDALMNAIIDAKYNVLLYDMDCTCLEPYHLNSHPICIKATG